MVPLGPRLSHKKMLYYPPPPFIMMTFNCNFLKTFGCTHLTVDIV